MKKLITLLVAFALVALCIFLLPTEAQAATEGDFTYTVTDDRATITDVDVAVSGNITIPSTLGGCPVTAIGQSAFADCTGITGITIPESVTTIGDSALKGCTGLKDVYYLGLQTKWEQVTIGEDNASLSNATIHFAACTHSYVDGVCTICGGEDPDHAAPTEPTDPSEPTDPTEPGANEEDMLVVFFAEIVKFIFSMVDNLLMLLFEK
ncbi:MAG: hypothetical protein E7461_01025 [Ruminococcaceae bacterium]|nr:hypothetical protein [Oscillospiraceae bacterium]